MKDVNPLLEPDEELAPENIWFWLLYVPPWTLEVAQQQVHAKERSDSLVDTPGTLCSLFVSLARSGKLGEYLKAEGELVPESQGGIGCETLSNEIRGESQQARPRMGKHEFRQLLVQLPNRDQSTLEQRNGDGNIVFTLEKS